jgi:hypothetical protein
MLVAILLTNKYLGNKQERHSLNLKHLHDEQVHRHCQQET